MTDIEFSGVYPAMCTPFDEDRSINFQTLRDDARRLIDAGVDGLVPVGSTGESATLSHDEHIEVVEAVVEARDEAEADVPVIAGAGSNNTREALELSRRSEEAGADALLHISPYYNKPEQAGFVDHFTTVADEVDVPVIVYNVPSRTGQSIDPETVATMAAHENITGYKAASGDLEQISEVVERTRGEDFRVLSGDDGLTLPILSVGGTGVISVAANVEPERMCALVNAALADDYARAREIHHELGPLFRGLFVETNPIPLKEAMAMRGHMSARLRSPLTRLSEEHVDDLREILSRLDEADDEEIAALAEGDR